MVEKFLMQKIFFTYAMNVFRLQKIVIVKFIRSNGITFVALANGLAM